jgi:integrase
LDPKTIRNPWGTVSLIWNAALAQRYVDALLPKPKLPRRPKKKARFFTLLEVARIIAASEAEHRVFYWLAAESGLRGGELAGLKLTDIDGERVTVNRSVGNGKEQSPKTNNAIRTLALSPQLVTLLWEQIPRQKARGSEYLFSSSKGTPLDMNVYRKHKMAVLLTSLKIPQAGFHAFRRAALYSQRQPNRILAVLQDMAAQWPPATIVTVGYPGDLQFSASSAASGASMWLGLISRKLAWSNGA